MNYQYCVTDMFFLGIRHLLSYDSDVHILTSNAYISVGCVFGELMKKEAIMQGRGELDQIDLIFKLLGVPNESNWPSFRSLPNSRTFRWKNKQAPQLSKKFPINSFSGGQTYLDPNGFDLLSRLLTLDPKNRITAKDALDHKYFREGVEKQMPNFLFFD